MDKRKSIYLLQIKDWLFISLGIILYLIGYVCFQLPYHFTPGGVAGIAAAVFYCTNIPVQYTFLALNAILLVFALKELGLKFLINTIYAVLFMSLMMAVIQNLIMKPDGTLPLFLGDQKFMACVIAAVLNGIGLGIVFLNNGSTGGTDIIAAIVNKYRDVSLGKIIMLADLLIISSSYLIFHSIELLLYGYCMMTVEMFTLDYSMTSVRQSVQFLIISKKYEEIATKIAKTGRGVTMLDGEGWYTKMPTKVLIVLCRRRESTRIFRIIRHADSAAFVSQGKVTGVFGEGFDRIKGK